MAGVSPSSSPRLPSPPPIAEDQIGPKSPIAASEEQGKLFGSVDHGASRRIRPGTKAADMAEGPPLVELTEIDSAFQLTEHLKALHNFLTHPPGFTTTIPIDKQKAVRLAQPPEGIDKALWLYELCRFLTQKVNSIIIALFSDNPPCSAQTCPEMRASEWQYLCAVHDPPKSCCAIDYCCHTLDWAANTLTSPKHFPSRLALGTETNSAHQQVRQLTNIFRRVYRIFAHAWFQHRDMFWKVENKSGLYIFFKTVCDVYSLIQEDNFTIPSEAEGIDSTPVVSSSPPPPAVTVLQKEDPALVAAEDGPEEAAGADVTVASGNTAKRHRPTPSIGATSVATVQQQQQASKDEPAKPESESKPEPESGSERIATPESEPEPEAETGMEPDAEGGAGPEAEKAEEEEPSVEGEEQEQDEQQEETAAVGKESSDAATEGEDEAEQPQITATAPEAPGPAGREESRPEKDEKSGADQGSAQPSPVVEEEIVEKERPAAGDAAEASTSVED
ncbi:Mob1/phocein [Glonium stellatum]|uniref:Mob1/phocein n=1 Tax=Glonium stellatum TaxID=574774 RepID=A0A8E2EQ44_9PEZI|nr:Mob1/phocein [Glonium stellatum]